MEVDGCLSRSQTGKCMCREVRATKPRRAGGRVGCGGEVAWSREHCLRAHRARARHRDLRSLGISRQTARRAAARAPLAPANRTRGVGPRVRRTEVYAKAYVQMIADRWFRGLN